MDVGPPGFLRFTGELTAEQEEQMRAHLRDQLGGGQVMILGSDVDYRPARPRDTHWQAPVSPQDAFTLRSVMAAYQANAQRLTFLREQQAADVAAAADAGTAGGRLGNAARVEQTRAWIVAAEEREREVLEELAEAHARATGRPLPPVGPRPPVPPFAAGSQRPTDPVAAALVELDSARADEHAARAELLARHHAPVELHNRYARRLRRTGVTATGLGTLTALAVTTGFPAIVGVVLTSLCVAVILLGLYNVTESRHLIARATEKIPAADEDHDAAVRRLVAAEAGALALGQDVTPSTLDAAVEAVAAAPPPLSW